MNTKKDKKPTGGKSGCTRPTEGGDPEIEPVWLHATQKMRENIPEGLLTGGKVLTHAWTREQFEHDPGATHMREVYKNYEEYREAITQILKNLKDLEEIMDGWEERDQIDKVKP